MNEQNGCTSQRSRQKSSKNVPREFERGWADQSGQTRLAGAEWTSRRGEIGQGDWCCEGEGW